MTMQNASPDSRPLSPHLQVYRWPVTMLTSILHRVTGGALYAGAVVLTLWLGAAALGEDAYNAMQSLLASWFGRLVLLGFTFALFTHLLSGVRHLFWDIGHGFNKSVASRGSVMILLFAGVLTFIAFWAAYAVGGAR